jgi:hypothetical protein
VVWVDASLLLQHIHLADTATVQESGALASQLADQGAQMFTLKSSK